MSLFNILFSSSQPFENSVFYFCKRLEVKVTKSTLSKSLSEHPNYQSLLSIIDFLNDLGVKTKGIKLPVSELPKITGSFMAHMMGRTVNHKVFVVVNSISKDYVELYNSEINRIEKLKKYSFEQLYRGVVLIAEPSSDAGEKEFKKNLFAENKKYWRNLFSLILIPIFLLLKLVLSYNENQNSVSTLFFAFFTLLGCILTLILLWTELDEYNPIVKQVCSQSRKINCSAVLKSKGANLFGVSWGIIGFSYFSGIILSLLANTNSEYNLFSILYWLTLTTLPYLFYSIYYQAFVIKQWCVLCIALLVIISAQFLTALLSGLLTYEILQTISLDVMFNIVGCFSFSLIATSILMRALLKAKDGEIKSKQLYRLKHNIEIFNALLDKQTKVKSTDHIPGITVGNPDAKYKILKVCNPFCEPCSKAHHVLENILDKNENVCLKIIFTTKANVEDITFQPTSHLLSIAQYGDAALTQKALQDWYGDSVKDYDIFAKKYAGYTKCEEQMDNIKKMREWCDDAKISFTPTIFVNGSQLPEIYNYDDLKYILK